jgi:predicted methyltransferase
MLNSVRRLRLVLLAAGLALAATGIAVVAQNRGNDTSREQWQKVDAVFDAMGISLGASVADIGAGDGFFTTRLSVAVGPEGRVHAVDVSDSALDRLRRRIERNNLTNVAVVKGTSTDPKLPEGAIDAALIVNAYHEMKDHQAMLAAIKRALKPAGRLVIVEPISNGRRDKSRDEQTRNHEIAPEFVEQDAREAGFTVARLEDPFTHRHDDTEWLMILTAQPLALAATPMTPLFSPRARWQ